jgi:hypothetical protein
LKSTGSTVTGSTQVRPRLRLALAVGAAALALGSAAASQALAAGATQAPGFSEPFAGNPKYEKYAPTEAAGPGQVNRPLGTNAANRIARELGLHKQDVFTAKQYALFISGGGVGGEKGPAKLVDESVRILTNTTGTPLYVKIDGKVTPTVLGSYGLFVNKAGMLESPANIDAPTRQVNFVIAPGWYMPTWMKQNGAGASLKMLYRSAYFSEAVYGDKAQTQSGGAQLAPYQKGSRSSIVGMSMAPPLWIVNFALIYTLNPRLAAKMPARWAPIPANVVLAIAESPSGQVPYSQYESSFHH